MDAYLAVVSKREVRHYAPQPIPNAVLTQILEAGRASGSSRNRQPWRFIVITDRERLAALSAHVYRPGNLTGCAAAIAVVVSGEESLFDAGRCAQNLMLAAWTLGVGTCPNTPRDLAAVRAILGVPDGMAIPTILTLGYPAPGEPRPRPKADPTRVLARVNRRPLPELLHRERYSG
ncbi:MAG: nitroreductase family protein [Armatimonadota bacterium]|nr:nitroreductase family protein [Armatimonadota bacterium]